MLYNKIIQFILLSTIVTSAQAMLPLSQNVNLLSNIKPGNESHYSDIWGYVDENGNEYALVCGFNGLYAVNISKPNLPVVSGFIKGPASIWRDVKVHENYAYVVTEGGGQNSGLQIVDLSNLPDSISLVKATTEFFLAAHNIFIADGYAYVVGTNDGGGVHILSLSNPTNPIEVAYYTESGYVHDVFVRGNILVACAAHYYDLINVAAKAHPKLISRSAELPGIYAHSGWMTEDNKYFYAAEEFNVRDLIVWDISDGQNWNIAVGSWQMNSNSTIHNIFIKNNFAHISYYGEGYVVLDISDPVNPALVGQYDTSPNYTSGYNGAWGCYPYLPSGNVIISDEDNGLFVLDFTLDNSNPTGTENEVLPANFEVSQNYPNPFNPSTNINYSLPQAARVSIKVFNVLGENVGVLVDEYQAAGNHSVKFSAGNLSGGIYFAYIEAGNFSKTIKMSLLK